MEPAKAFAEKYPHRRLLSLPGFACTSGSLQPSHVLRAMGVPFTKTHGSNRFSLSSYNTEQEIDFVIEKFPPIIEELRTLSPYWELGQAVCATRDVEGV